MEKRVLLAVFLSFLVLYAYQAFVAPPSPKQPPAPSAQSDRGADHPTAGAPSPAESIAAQGPSPALEPTTGAPLVGEVTERAVTIETDLIAATFSNRGAVLTSWKLKKFLDARGQALELVPTGLPPSLDRPFSLGTDRPDLTRRIDQALFSIVAPAGASSRVDARRTRETIGFAYQDASGLRVRKTFVFAPGSYVITLAAAVLDGDREVNPEVRWGPALGDVANTGESSRYTKKAEGVIFREGKIERLSAAAVAKQRSYDGDLRYVGVDDHYFLSAAIHPGQSRADFDTVTQPAVGSDKPHEFVSYRMKYAAPPTAAQFYVGPKKFDVLAAIDRELVRVIDFGWFAFLVVPFLLPSLQWIYGYVGNYGWAIIILTIVINAVMFPLRHKSVVSMRKMQEVQPEVKAIQDRYAKLKTTDPARQKMNVELMNLYRERGVNPASGCWPMLLTMPVLFAFYSLLSQAIELRGAHFMLWINDLSLHDPLYVTPILMGVTMVVQQRMTPSTADPAQQKMMMFMPIVFTFMFLWVPSGLVLYWLVSNLWAIGQQHVTNRMIGAPVVKTVRPPAERRLKKVGGGKTNGAKIVSDER